MTERPPDDSIEEEAIFAESQLFGELRAILSDPGEGSWDRLLDCMEPHWEREGIEQRVLPYLRRILSQPGWSGRQRAMPRERLLAAIDGAPGATRMLQLTERLALREERLDTQALALFLRGAHLRHLRSLQFYDCDLEGCMDHACQLESLEELDLRANPLRAIGLSRLAQAPLPALKKLDVSGCELDNYGLSRLLGLHHVEGLRELRLAQNHLNGRVGSSLAVSSHLRQLRRLDLSGNPIGAEGLKSIAMGVRLDSLAQLDLAGCAVTFKSLLLLARGPRMMTLRRLDVRGVELSRDQRDQLLDEGFLGLEALRW